MISSLSYAKPIVDREVLESFNNEIIKPCCNQWDLQTYFYSFFSFYSLISVFSRSSALPFCSFCSIFSCRPIGTLKYILNVNNWKSRIQAYTHQPLLPIAQDDREDLWDQEHPKTIKDSSLFLRKLESRDLPCRPVHLFLQLRLSVL